MATIASVGHLICLGVLSLTNREFSLAVLAARLTVIGFAVNDRIVMFDGLREMRTGGATVGQLGGAPEANCARLKHSLPGTTVALERSTSEVREL